MRAVIIHVGSLNNKGTQALLKCDFSLLKSILGADVVFSVSTTDVSGVQRIFSLKDVFSPAIDIPFEFADSFAKRLGFSRSSPRYKFIALASLILVPVEMFLSVLSATLVKIGLTPFYRKKFFRGLKDGDLIISCSDENFKEGVSLLPSDAYWTLTWWTLLLSRTWDVLTAKFLKKPLIMFPNSIGPFRTAIGRFLAKLALRRYNYILVREFRSYKTLDSMGMSIPRILTSDIALLLDADHGGFDAGVKHPVVGVCLGVYSHTLSEKQTHSFIELSARVLDAAIRKHHFSVIFLPHYVSNFRFDDLQFSELVLERMDEKASCKILNVPKVEEFKNIIGHMDMVVSSKMHPAVLGVASYVPAVCIAYDDKQLGFFEQLNLADCVLPINKVSEQALNAIIDSVWNKRLDIEMSLRKSIPVAQQHIRCSARKVLEHLLEDVGEDAD